MFDSTLWITLLISLASILVLTVGMAMFYRNKPKTDKGFKVAYYGLTYRRKFWRTIYSSPIFILLIILMYFLLGFEPLFIGYTIFTVIIFIVQAYYNYVKWKKEETAA